MRSSRIIGAVFLLAVGVGVGMTASYPYSEDKAAAPYPYSGDKVAALTFDDGPEPGATEHVLDILKRHNARATFFVVGKLVAQRPDLVRRVHAEGHVIGNHTYTHPHMTSLTPAARYEEIRRTEEAIVAAGVPEPTLFRPPYADTSRGVYDQAASLGESSAGWNADPGDYATPPPAAAAADVKRRVLDSLRPGAIYVLHDHSEATQAALPEIIRLIRERGYRLGVLVPQDPLDDTEPRVAVR